MSGCEGNISATGADVVTSTGDSCQEPSSVPVTNASPVDGADGGDEKTKDINSPEGMVQLEMDNAEHAVVHFQENASSDPEARPEPTTIFGKIYRWWDCDVVWIGFLLLGTVAAFTMFITFIAMSSGSDKEPIDQSQGNKETISLLRN